MVKHCTPHEQSKNRQTVVPFRQTFTHEHNTIPHSPYLSKSNYTYATYCNPHIQELNPTGVEVYHNIHHQQSVT